MIADMLELVSLWTTQSGEVYKHSSVMRKHSSVRAIASGDGEDEERENGERKTGRADAVARMSDRWTLAGQRDGNDTDRQPDAENSDVDCFRGGKGGRHKLHLSTLAPKLPNYSSISICQWESNI